MGTYYKKSPLKTVLKGGIKHAFCTCGKSEKMPFCNGAHRGSSDKPIKFTLESDTEVLLCRCGKSKNPPYCDGSHSGQ